MFFVQIRQKSIVNIKSVRLYSNRVGLCCLTFAHCMCVSVCGSVCCITTATAYRQGAAGIVRDRLCVCLWVSLCVALPHGVYLFVSVCNGGVSRFVMQWSWWRLLGPFRSRATRQTSMPTAVNRWLSKLACLYCARGQRGLFNQSGNTTPPNEQHNLLIPTAHTLQNYNKAKTV